MKKSWRSVCFCFCYIIQNHIFTHMCSNTWVVKFLKNQTTLLNMENPLLFPHLSYVCMVCRRARVKASNLAYYGNWGRSKSCTTLTGCCRSWLLPQTTHDKYYFSQLCRSPFGVLMTYLTIQLLYVGSTR